MAAVETSAETPALKPHTDEPGILQATPAEEATAEKPAEGEGAEPKVEAEAEPPAYEFAAPDGFNIAEERLGELQAVMREANVPKEQAEKLWGMHTAAMAELRAGELQAQHDAFAEMRRGWRNQIAADPELGGAGYETNKAAANRMLQLFVPQQHRAEMDQFLSTTGATDHPALVRLLVNLAKRHDELQTAPPNNPRPPSAREQQGPRPRANGGARLFEYDHPRGGG